MKHNTNLLICQQEHHQLLQTDWSISKKKKKKYDIFSWKYQAWCGTINFGEIMGTDLCSSWWDTTLVPLNLIWLKGHCIDTSLQGTRLGTRRGLSLGACKGCTNLTDASRLLCKLRGVYPVSSHGDLSSWPSLDGRTFLNSVWISYYRVTEFHYWIVMSFIYTCIFFF